MIRPLTEQDLDMAADIIRWVWQTVYAGIVDPALRTGAGLHKQVERLTGEIASHYLKEYVWEEEGRVLALLSMGDTADTDRPGAFEVWRLYVAEEARRKGIGSRLLAFAEEYARERSFTRVVIWTFRKNRPAVAFYQKHGYSPDGENYHGEPVQAWEQRLRKEL